MKTEKIVKIMKIKKQMTVKNMIYSKNTSLLGKARVTIGKTVVTTVKTVVTTAVTTEIVKIVKITVEATPKTSVKL